MSSLVVLCALSAAEVDSRKAKGGPVSDLVEFKPPFWRLPSAMDRLTQLLASSPKVVLNARDKGNHSPMNMAAFHGNLPGVRALIAAGGDAGNADKAGDTPLHHVVHGHHYWVDEHKELLRADSPLLSPAMMEVRAQIVHALLGAGARVTANRKGHTARTLAAAHNLSAVLKALS